MDKDLSNIYRKRRICYWDAEKKFTDSSKINFERHLSFLPDFDLVNLVSLEDENFQPCDLLIVAATAIDEDIFHDWLKGLNKRIIRQNSIWTPCIIVTEISFAESSQSLHTFADNNWYFDILHPHHTDSIPIRVANLLKIHDHLHELFR